MRRLFIALSILALAQLASPPTALCNDCYGRRCVNDSACMNGCSCMLPSGPGTMGFCG